MGGLDWWEPYTDNTGIPTLDQTLAAIDAHEAGDLALDRFNVIEQAYETETPVLQVLETKYGGGSDSSNNSDGGSNSGGGSSGGSEQGGSSGGSGGSGGSEQGGDLVDMDLLLILLGLGIAALTAREVL